MAEAEVRSEEARRRFEIGVQKSRRAERPLSPEAQALRHHHERWDGRGYPDRLRGEAIPLGARVLAMADAFDALTSDRSYRKSSPPEEALAILLRETQRGHWDPAVFAALDAMVREERGP
jgi:HD-GYP domain-containing protein (c-di-GMP phosphodiesterase class II)